ncbi:hypothetical protein G6011_05414 [Alternaria panax]|uniref:Ecp2 effector protein domain-containing protein n=1 Tax=Alternaria panax TaxID=48097 RepID=A0AAD4I6H6_9PLEO|nr:hypothetical protein G6011_05414 [Alternaria panax]
MYTITFLTTLLSAIVIPSTLGTAIPSISPPTNATSLFSRSPKGCLMTHYLTESHYRQIVRQHCDNHFPRWHPSDEKLVYTYDMADYRGYPIRWILSTHYKVGDRNTISLGLTRDDCYDRFNAFLDGGSGIGDEGEEGKTWCTVNVAKYGKGKGGLNGGKLVTGGKYNMLRGTGGAELWVETRKRKDDKYKPPPEDIHLD